MKSNVYFSRNMDSVVFEEICRILEMPKTEDLGRYLGVPAIHGRVTKSTYQGVITRIDKRLAGWKSKCLSLAGRVTLISWLLCCPSLSDANSKNPMIDL